MRKLVLLALCIIFVAGCTTQRYGRAQPLSEIEKKELTCREIKIEIGKTEEFLSDVQIQRSKVSGTHLIGAIGDFGIGNHLEGEEAELSGHMRLKELKNLQTQKECDA